MVIDGDAEQKKQLETQINLLSILALVAGAAIAWLMTHMITKPIKSMARNAKRIAS